MEKILGRKYEGGKPFYYIKWKGYAIGESTWEPEENLESIQDMIAEFEKEYEGSNEEKIMKSIQLNRASKKIQKTGRNRKNSTLNKLKRRSTSNSSKAEKNSDDEVDELYNFEEEIKERSSKFGDLFHNMPVQITDHATLGNKSKNMNRELEQVPLQELLFKVEWGDKNGKKPAPTYFSYNILKHKCPFLVLDYIEKMINPQ